MGFGSVFKKVVSAPVKIAKTVAKPLVAGAEKIIDTGGDVAGATFTNIENIGSKTWKGVKTTGKALTSPEGASLIVAGTGVATGNPALISTGLGSLSKNYIDEKRANQQIALEKAVFDQAIQNQQDLNAVYNRDQSLAGLLLDSGITFTDNVQTTSDLAQDRVVNQPITKDGIGSTIGIISVVAILAFLGSRYIK